MYRPRLSKFVSALLGFVLGLCVGIFGHSLVTGSSTGAHTGDDTEAMRITSPDGKLDAVLVEDTGGGPLGGVFWYLYVVPRGDAVPKDGTKRLFFADELTKGMIVWSKPHLLEIHYDKASIMQFRNFSTEYENRLEYVELRLVPSSERSLITAEGMRRSDN
jgi:hypothetical protein